MKPKDLTYLDAISDIDWARLAAYIDGEGCIRIKSNQGASATSRRVFYVELVVSNTDVRLIEWLRAKFGGTVTLGSNRANPRWARCATWHAGARHASELIRRCYSFLIIKREQADIALAFQATILPHRPYGMKGRPAELVARQETMAQQLSDLKGTAAQRKRPRSVSTTTIQ